MQIENKELKKCLYVSNLSRLTLSRARFESFDLREVRSGEGPIISTERDFFG